MPNLRSLRDAGAHFVHHVAAQPVCGPSRSSLLTGRYPHNTGYYANLDVASIANWLKVQNNTVGTWLTAAGYHTSFTGKYVNGCESHIPEGWNFWGAFSSSKGMCLRNGGQHLGIVLHTQRKRLLSRSATLDRSSLPSTCSAGTYNYYNATPYNVTFDSAGKRPLSPIVDVPMTGIHQADFVGQWGVEQMRIAAAAGKPFFVHLTPTMVHEGTCYGPYADESNYAKTDPYWEKDLSQGFGCTTSNAQTCTITVSSCPSTRHAHAFDGVLNPHVQSWNATESGLVPKVMTKNPPLTAYESGRQDIGFRNRSSSLLDLDDMIGVVLKGIDDLGVADNTFVIFTSDNGFHLGEHRMLFGKEHPYDTDISLPLYIRGPGVPANSTLLYPTTPLDITATIVELAGATPVGPPLDGLSFAAAFSANPPAPAAWRDFSFTEFFGNANTWWTIRRPLAADNTKQVFWCDGDNEVFDLAADAFEMQNIAAAPRGTKIVNKGMPLGVALSVCKGAACSAPEPTTVPPKPLPCKTVTKGALPPGEIEWD